MTDEARKKQFIPSNYRINKIEAGWKGQIDILRSLNKRYSPVEDRKSATFFKIIDAITELGGPTIIRNSTLIFVDDLEYEVSKLKDKWAREFDILSYFFEENIRTWVVNYVNLNNNIVNIVLKEKEEIIEIDKEMFEMNINRK